MPVEHEVVDDNADVVVEQPSRVVYSDDPVGSAWAASQMISTIVWAIVVLVLLGVGLYALHVYLGWF